MVVSQRVRRLRNRERTVTPRSMADGSTKTRPPASDLAKAMWLTIERETDGSDRIAIH